MKTGIGAPALAPESFRPERRLVLAAAGAAGVVLVGCASEPLNPNAWRATPMAEAPVKPSAAALAGSRRTRVVVFPTTESPSARGAGLHLVAAAAVETMLGKGGVEIVDRNLATRLDDELKLAEMRGAGGAAGAYAGPDVADYAVRVVMGTAGWRTQYVEASEYKDKNGKITRTPASHAHYGNSSMSIRIHEIPSLRLVQSIAAEGSTARTGMNVAATASDGLGLMRAATDSGINGKRTEVLNEFSPKGYVTERRVKDSESIFRVMLGRNTGAKSGDEVLFYSLNRIENPLTRQVSFDEVQVAKGRMSNLVGDAESWVLVTDPKEAAALRLGDVARVRHGRGGFFGLGG